MFLGALRQDQPCLVLNCTDIACFPLGWALWSRCLLLGLCAAFPDVYQNNPVPVSTPGSVASTRCWDVHTCCLTITILAVTHRVRLVGIENCSWSFCWDLDILAEDRTKAIFGCCMESISMIQLRKEKRSQTTNFSAVEDW